MYTWYDIVSISYCVVSDDSSRKSQINPHHCAEVSDHHVSCLSLLCSVRLYSAVMEIPQIDLIDSLHSSIHNATEKLEFHNNLLHTISQEQGGDILVSQISVFYCHLTILKLRLIK